MDDFLDLSKYTKQAYIDQGASGEVYKVIENETGKVFAAKIFLRKLTEDEKPSIVSLRREINIISKLTHPSILKFIGYSPIDFTEESKPVIITEYSSNGSLASIISLESKSLSPPLWDDTKKLITLYGISSAMAYLHSHDIIHRDLKPANILEDDFLFPKIADFGLSKIIHNNPESMTTQSTTGFKGTPAYVPPEAWSDDIFSKEGDVYSFAIIAYQLLTLEEPFRGTSIYRLGMMVANGERPPLTEHVPECYADLIKRCWAQKAGDRPTFEAIRDELRSNEAFITEGVDRDEFMDYVMMVDGGECGFDPTKRFAKVILSDAEKEAAKKSKKGDMKETAKDTKSSDVKETVEDTKSGDVKETVEDNKSGDVKDKSGESKNSEFDCVKEKVCENDDDDDVIEIESKKCDNVKVEERQKRFRRKVVEHHEPHSLFGKSSKRHTHFTIFNVTKTEQRTVLTDSDGNVSYSEWTNVPEKEIKEQVDGGMEKGFTAGYENEI